MESFGKKLRTIRKNVNLTQADLAKKLGLSASTIGMYEQNRREPNFEILRKICDVLSTHANYLIGDQEADSDIIENSKGFIELVNNTNLQIGNKKADREQTQKARKIIISAVEKAIKDVYKIILDEGLK